ncbi:hypothetical protein CDL15_Pgr026172 [Punica granatum]|uniref:Uncharacterized protein n=1 Tax=Punica granatum TaxID=22663 RepID=A0A218WXA1_PUNGR|nr:hypothetical protein CDL15_Pgr026172 [Punica granatum]PKI59724.1 hypothetical protein CRG98_019900 [Punica granatum]
MNRAGPDVESINAGRGVVAGTVDSGEGTVTGWTASTSITDAGASLFFGARASRIHGIGSTIGPCKMELRKHGGIAGVVDGGGAYASDGGGNPECGRAHPLKLAADNTSRVPLNSLVVFLWNSVAMALGLPVDENESAQVD